MRTTLALALSIHCAACSSSSSEPAASSGDDGGVDAAAIDSGTIDGAASDSAASDTGSASDAADDTSSGPAHASPPPAPPTKAGDGTGSVTFAISKLYLGDTRRDGTPDKTNAWKAYGYDLDGKISTASSTDVCKPAAGASSNVKADGDDGIDNAYGKMILPIELAIASDTSAKANQAIADGKHTTIIDIQKLGAGSDYSPLVGALYDGADLGSPPKFDGSDSWPVTAESVTGGDVGKPKQPFSMSYLAGGTWVSGSPGDIVMTLPLFGGQTRITLHHAVITMKLDPARTSATFGTIAGVLSTAEVTAAIRKAVGAIDASLCSGSTIDSVVTQIAQASDILSDGTQDATKTCDGISIGLGFDATAVQLGSVAAPVTPPPDSCE